MPTPRFRSPDLAGEPPQPTVEPAPGDPRVILDLRTITPVVGGGVEPFEPDEVDPVRVPGIRGQLREWWRRLYARESESIEAFFAREASLWGGVGVGGESAGAASKPKDGPGLRSRVVLWLDPATLRPGSFEAAGVHPAEPGKSPKAMARWNGGQEFGYALFPLQRADRERREWRRGQELPTRRVRRNLAFRLMVSLRQGARKRTAGDPREPVRQVLATLWTWIHLGGVGARTRRGFGALEIASAAQFEGFPPALEDLVQEWQSLLSPGSDEEFEGRFERFQQATRATCAHWPPRLYAGQPLVAGTARGDREGAAQRAHSELLKHFRLFRQGSGFARDPAPRPKEPPGRSRWPEANLLRLRREPDAEWEHAVPDEAKAERGRLGAPRAAFGLPIVMHFKSGPRVPGREPDEHANGQILPEVADRSESPDRWASPVLLRPVPGRNGAYRPLVAVLRGPRPEAVRLRYNGEERDTASGIAIAASAGARFEIRSLLSKHGGDAIGAFTSWLIDKRSFKPVGATAGDAVTSASRGIGHVRRPPGGRRA